MTLCDCEPFLELKDGIVDVPARICIPISDVAQRHKSCTNTRQCEILIQLLDQNLTFFQMAQFVFLCAQ
jgi:hypothetical protein